MPSWLFGLKKHIGHRYLYVTYTFTSTYTNTTTPHKAPKSRRSKINIIHISNNCQVINKMALWQLKPLSTLCMWCTVSFFIVYNNLLANFRYICIRWLFKKLKTGSGNHPMLLITVVLLLFKLENKKELHEEVNQFQMSVLYNLFI